MTDTESGTGKNRSDSGSIAGKARSGSIAAAKKTAAVAEKEYTLFMTYVPGFNLIYDVLLDEPPSLENIEKLFNVVALMSALVLSVAASLPTGVDVGELTDTNARYGINGTYWCYDIKSMKHHPYFISNRFTSKTQESVITLALCTLMIVIMYLCMASANFDASDPKSVQAKVTIWWRAALVPLMGAFISLVYGLYAFFISMYYMAYIKYPDHAIEEECAKLNRTTYTGDGIYYGAKYDNDNSPLFQAKFAFDFFGPSLAVTILCMSLGSFLVRREGWKAEATKAEEAAAQAAQPQSSVI